jgi:uncharacterized protein (TIGR02421 family)
MRSDWELAHKLDQLLFSVAEKVRPLPSLTAEDAAEERVRLLRDLERGELPVPTPQPRRSAAESGVFRLLDQGRRLTEESELGTLYLERFDELELDLAILAAFGEPKRVRELSARRYGTGHESVSVSTSVTTSAPPVSVGVLAQQLLDQLAPCDTGPRVLPASAPSGQPSVARLVLRAAAGIGLDPSVRVEPRLASLAATGERTVFLSARMYSLHEARRLVAHEVFGHLVVAANARAQPLRLLSVGLAGAFSDQEGVSLYLEAALGLMASDRLRTLAARVMATQWLHAGASFGETARRLYVDYGLSAESAILTAERTYRGGGVARDAGYLSGFVRVRAALAAGAASLDELRRGRVALAHVSRLRQLERAGWLRTPCYRPSLALSRSLTFAGTSAETSPPSDAASLTMLELT